MEDRRRNARYQGERRQGIPAVCTCMGGEHIKYHSLAQQFIIPAHKRTIYFSTFYF